MTGSELYLEKKIEASIYLMGSFQDSVEANDIDLIIVYREYDFQALRKIKSSIERSLSGEFGLPIHFTTLSDCEYLEVENIRSERHQIIFDVKNVRYEN